MCRNLPHGDHKRNSRRRNLGCVWGLLKENPDLSGRTAQSLLFAACPGKQGTAGLLSRH